MNPIGDLAGEPKRARSCHRPDLEWQRLLNRPRGCEQSRVPVELTQKVNAAIGQERAHHLVRFAKTGKRPGALPLDAVLIEQRQVADGENDLGATARKLIEGRGLLRD